MKDTNQASACRFSIVMPTYQRREEVTASVQALAGQTYEEGFEVIVVVDGSTDGTAGALQSLKTPFPFRVIHQPNRGASAARNRGAEAARGEILLFLDDDMEAHPRLLAEHDRSHRQGADAVIGHIPLHPDSPKTIISEVIGRWAEERVEQLLAANGNLPFQEIMTGQLSIAGKIFFKLGGFNTRFTREGAFGNEDLDFGLRLRKSGYHIIFNPKAVSRQRYVVTPRQYLRQYRQAGRADVLFARLHPDRADHLFTRSQSRLDRMLWCWCRPLIRRLTLTLLDLNRRGPLAAGLFFRLVNLEYYRGVREAGGIPRPGPLRILCYHAIADLSGAPVVEAYGVPPKQFRRQLDLLRRWNFQFIDAEEFLRFLQGRAGLPRRAVLLTFDDCYRDLLDAALPILEEKGIPAVAFAVTGRLGKTNDWDTAAGAPPIRLLDSEGLRQLARGRIAIGAHTRSHRILNRISPEQLKEEIQGSLEDLEALGFERPAMLAYPYGEYDENVQKAARAAGLQAALTVEPSLVKPGVNPYRIPRIEIFRRDTGWRFLWKVWGKGGFGGLRD